MTDKDTTDTVMCFKCSNRPAGEGKILCTVCRDAIQNRPAADYYKQAKR